jgi:fructosamine-3-kinase
MKAELENILKENIISIDTVGGGCIADAKRIRTKSGNLFFAKQYDNSDVHKAEAIGLNELNKPNVIKIPKVIYYDDSILILEYIQQGNRKKNFSEIFGKQFAKLHKFTSDKFGFREDNFCGNTVQKNTPTNDNWIDFYFTNRLLFQYKLTEKNNYVTNELQDNFLKLEKRIGKILEAENERPSLLHGDLWGGNYIFDEKGNPCLIDPAVYYGNREADLAMTKIFGGFDSVFYKAYQKEYPLQDGWQYRENIYKLYHIFNHLNLFGMTYHNQVLQLIKFYL